MSRHYVSARFSNLFRGTQDISKVIEKVAKVRPELAKKLAKMDWAALRGHVAKEALHKAAEKLNAQHKTDTFKVEQEFHRPVARGTDKEEQQQIDRAYKSAALNFPGSKCLGVLKRGDSQVGIYQHGENLRCREISDTRGTEAGVIRFMKNAINKAYTEQSIEGALKIVGDSDVKTARQEDGTLIMETEITDKQKVIA